MRRTILKAINDRLTNKVGDIKFIDLWNEQLATMQVGAVWPVPAVFIEFEQISWRQEANHVRTADITVRLHIITRAVKYNGLKDVRQINAIKDNSTRIDAALDYFDLIDRINAAMQSLSGDNFTSFMHTISVTNSSHAEFIESIECYTTRAVDASAIRKASTVVNPQTKIC